MPPCSRSAANRRVTPITAASSSVTHRTPEASVAVERVAVEAEVEQHVDRDREQRHRRHRLLGAQLEQQVLAQDRARPRGSPVELLVVRRRGGRA